MADPSPKTIRPTPDPFRLCEYLPERHDAESPSEIQTTREAAIPKLFESERFAPGWDVRAPLALGLGCGLSKSAINLAPLASTPLLPMRRDHAGLRLFGASGLVRFGRVGVHTLNTKAREVSAAKRGIPMSSCGRPLMGGRR